MFRRKSNQIIMAIIVVAIMIGGYLTSTLPSAMKAVKEGGAYLYDIKATEIQNGEYYEEAICFALDYCAEMDDNTMRYWVAPVPYEDGDYISWTFAIIAADSSYNSDFSTLSTKTLDWFADDNAEFDWEDDVIYLEMKAMDYPSELTQYIEEYFEGTGYTVDEDIAPYMLKIVDYKLEQKVGFVGVGMLVLGILALIIFICVAKKKEKKLREEEMFFQEIRDHQIQSMNDAMSAEYPAEPQETMDEKQDNIDEL